MKKVRSLIAIIAIMNGFGLVNQSVNAATGYHRTKTTSVSKANYYSLSDTGATYAANGSTTNFKFKVNHYLKNYKHTTWTRSSKTYITKNGKKYLYYYVHNSRNSAAGWVWNGYLKSGRNFQSDAAKSIKSKSVYRKSTGTLYNLTGKNYTQFTDGHKLSTNVTYAQSKQMYVYKYGVKYIYAYVKGADGTKGWIWHGYLNDGRDYQMTAAKTVTKANYVMAKAGNIYQLGSNRNLISFANPVSLSSDKMYVVSQSATVYKKGTAYSYYYVVARHAIPASIRHIISA